MEVISFVLAIDEGIEMETGGSAASSNSDASSVSSEAATNDRNARELASKVIGWKEKPLFSYSVSLFALF